MYVLYARARAHVEFNFKTTCRVIRSTWPNHLIHASGVTRGVVECNTVFDSLDFVDPAVLLYCLINSLIYQPINNKCINRDSVGVRVNITWTLFLINQCSPVGVQLKIIIIKTSLTVGFFVNLNVYHLKIICDKFFETARRLTFFFFKFL